MQSSELHPELLGIHGTNFTIGTDSASRSQMYSSHLSQALVIEGSTEKRFQTGVEMRLGEYTFAIKAPCNMRVIKVIDRYPRQLGIDVIPENPESMIIYEDIKTQEVGCISIPRFASYHQHFGFEYKLHQAFYSLRQGAVIAKDTVFADSPSKSANGGYKPGIELNIAFMSHPAVSEDGVMISRDILDRLKFKIYERRVVKFGTEYFPLNLYGNQDYYKPFPNIGEYIREDGILAMLRQYDMTIAPVDISITDTMEPDFVFDKPIYVRGPGGKVIDIKMYHDDTDVSLTPQGIMKNMDKYYVALKDYYKNILDTYHQIRSYRKKKFGENSVNLTPEFHRLIIEAMAILADQTGRSNQKLNLVYKKEALDDYRVEFVIEYEMTPTVGFKMTDSHGGKGIICHIAEPEDMPIDAAGNRADIVMDGGSTLDRMNLGRLYEVFFGSVARDVTKSIIQHLNLGDFLKTLTVYKRHAVGDIPEQSEYYQMVYSKVSTIFQSTPQLIKEAYDLALEFYGMISLRQHNYYSKLSDQDMISHLAYVVCNGIFIYYPTDNEFEMSETVKALQARYHPTYGPVRYAGYSGKYVMTEYNVRIGPIYMFLLDKIADSFSSVSSATLQHFGILSPVTKGEKYSHPHRNSPVRTIGETEGRIFGAYCGAEAIAEMLDMCNSPQTHKMIVNNILTADKPTNIDRVVDRSVIPLGGSKSLQIVSHIGVASGWRFVYRPDTYAKITNRK